jgi:hypothetical protein
MNEELKPQEARQGKKGVPVLKVLIIALILAIIAWAGAEFFGQQTAPEEPVGETTIENDASDEAPTGEAPTVEPSTPE